MIPKQPAKKKTARIAPRCAQNSRRENRADARGVAKQVKEIMNPAVKARVRTKQSMIVAVNKKRAAAQLTEDAAEWVVGQVSPRRSPRKGGGPARRKIGAAAACRHFGLDAVKYVRARAPHTVHCACALC
jgi:hypothetical protein